MRASVEAREISIKRKAEALKYFGSSVSPEWLMPKALRIKRQEIYEKAFKILEACDVITRMLTGELCARQIIFKAG